MALFSSIHTLYNEPQPTHQALADELQVRLYAAIQAMVPHAINNPGSATAPALGGAIEFMKHVIESVQESRKQPALVSTHAQLQSSLNRPAASSALQNLSLFKRIKPAVPIAAELAPAFKKSVP